MYFFCLYIVQFSSFASLLFFCCLFVIVKWKQQKKPGNSKMEDTRSMYGNTLNVVSCRTPGYVAINAVILPNC